MEYTVETLAIINILNRFSYRILGKFTCNLLTISGNEFLREKSLLDRRKLYKAVHIHIDQAF